MWRKTQSYVLRHKDRVRNRDTERGREGRAQDKNRVKWRLFCCSRKRTQRHLTPWAFPRVERQRVACVSVLVYRAERMFEYIRRSASSSTSMRRISVCLCVRRSIYKSTLKGELLSFDEPNVTLTDDFQQRAPIGVCWAFSHTRIISSCCTLHVVCTRAKDNVEIYYLFFSVIHRHFPNGKSLNEIWCGNVVHDDEWSQQSMGLSLI